ncbi:MAG: hypothetical protein Q9160_001029 [Pyrenula sp. 1 TL-2023]
MPTYLITGANRGLGLEFVRQLSSDTSNIILATCRSPDAASDLKAFASKSSKIHVLQCDTSSLSSISSLHAAVSKALGGSGKIDYLLNNAGINSAPQHNSIGFDPSVLHREVDVNVIGPAKVVETLLSLLGQGSVIMNMTSGLGSIGGLVPKCTTYSISKVALNMLTAHQAIDLKERGVLVFCMDPGWVKTDLGGEGAVMEPQESIAGMLKVLKGLGEGDTGKFYGHDGRILPW